MSFNNINMFFLTEAKLDETFPCNQFEIEDYKYFRLGRNSYGGGVYVYVNQDIAARRAEYSSLSNIGSICFELNLRKPRWLLTGIYKPPSHNEGDFIKKNLFSYLTNTTKEFRNIVLLRDFNITTENI